MRRERDAGRDAHVETVRYQLPNILKSAASVRLLAQPRGGLGSVVWGINVLFRSDQKSRW